MAVPIPGAPRKLAARPVFYGPGRQRKVAILGSAPGSLKWAPFADPSWEFWAHSSSVVLIPHFRADRIFDTHPKHCFTEQRKCGMKDYFGYLKTCPTPIYMQQHFEDIPSSVRYPLEMVRQQWPRVPIGSQTAMMIALALLEGVTHLGFWGVDYASGWERDQQRINAERWVGIAEGLGVHIILPASTPFCQEPREIYAYETHATPEQYEARKAVELQAKQAVGPKGPAFDPARLVPCDTSEDFARSRAILASKDADWAKEAAQFNDPKCAIPPAILEKEARERAELQQSGVGVPAPAGLPRDHAGSEVPPGAGGGGRGARRRSGTKPGDGLVQPGLHPVDGGPDRARRASVGRATTKRRAVSGARRAAGRRRPKAGR
jgi:hypothetical protein